MFFGKAGLKIEIGEELSDKDPVNLFKIGFRVWKIKSSLTANNSSLVVVAPVARAQSRISLKNYLIKYFINQWEINKQSTFCTDDEMKFVTKWMWWKCNSILTNANSSLTESKRIELSIISSTEKCYSNSFVENMTDYWFDYFIIIIYYFAYGKFPCKL